MKLSFGLIDWLPVRRPTISLTSAYFSGTTSNASDPLTARPPGVWLEPDRPAEAKGAETGGEADGVPGGARSTCGGNTWALAPVQARAASRDRPKRGRLEWRMSAFKMEVPERGPLRRPSFRRPGEDLRD